MTTHSQMIRFVLLGLLVQTTLVGCRAPPSQPAAMATPPKMTATEAPATQGLAFDPHSLSFPPAPFTTIQPDLLAKGPAAEPIAPPGTQPASRSMPEYDPLLDRARSTTDVTALIWILKSPTPSPAALSAAILGLADRGPAAVDAVPALVDEMLIDRHGLQRTARIAIRAVGPAAMKPLLEQCTRPLPDPMLTTLYELVRTYPAEARAQVPALLAALRLPVVTDLGSAMRQLAAIGPLLDQAAVDAVANCLADPLAAVRTDAMTTIMQALPREQWKPYLTVASLSDRSSDRLKGMLTLADGDVELRDTLRALAESQLVVLVDDDDAKTRMLCVRAMVAIHCPAERAIPAIVTAHLKAQTARLAKNVGDSVFDQGADGRALMLLTGYGEKGVPGVGSLLSLIGNRDDTDAVVRCIVCRFGPAAVGPVIEFANSADASQRGQCLAILSDIYPCPPEAVTALSDTMLSGKEPAVRLAAAQALGQCAPRPASAWAALVQAARDPDPAVRRAVLHSLSIIAPPAAADAPRVDPQLLREWLDFTDIDARAEAARLLASAGPAARDATPALARMAGNELAPLRRAAAEALVAIDPAGEQNGHAMINAALQADAETAVFLATKLSGSAKLDKLRQRLDRAGGSTSDVSVKAATTQAAEGLRD